MMLGEGLVWGLHASQSKSWAGGIRVEVMPLGGMERKLAGRLWDGGPFAYSKFLRSVRKSRIHVGQVVLA